LHLDPGAELRLLIERPPCTLEQATMIAAEHSVFLQRVRRAGIARAFRHRRHARRRTDLDVLVGSASLTVSRG
jgi:hypothetical protein